MIIWLCSGCPHLEQSMISQVTREAKVGPNYARKILCELRTMGAVTDPSKITSEKVVHCGTGTFLELDHDLFVLSLWVEMPERMNLNYCQKLHDIYDLEVSPSFISDLFEKRWLYKL